ncbi:DUF4350 domain-containing protein [Paenarthrobacter sp. NPDC057981]|uniref:DUF4350 domain-containing protein n=1 Tax=Paenarthrobacter sp. NPDC057981 TaxID=3346297 RepID=UPI0036DBFC1D
MTMTANEAPLPLEPDQAGGSTEPGFSNWFRKHLTWIALGAVLVALVTYLAVTNMSGTADPRTLSARNPAPDGAMAAAEILGRHGVNLTTTDSFDQTMSALTDNDRATVLLYDPRGYLDRSRVEELAAAADRAVVVKPRLKTLNGLGPGFTPGGVIPGDQTVVEAACSVEDAMAAGPISAQGSVFSGPQVCYSGPAEGTGLYAASADGRVIVLGSTDIVDNEHLALQGNAALALRTLGNNPDLIWYLPGVKDVAATDKAPTLSELAPTWLAYAGPWLGAVTVLAILWRGRRMGPLVFEPLPVVVKAAETAEGRARLYQDARAVNRAAGNLRAGTLSRLARHFNLGADATADAVVDACARRLERTGPEVRSVLVDFMPGTEGQLVQWAQELERMEEEAKNR